MGSERWDVIVVGGGPAGSAVSALLARRGYDVLVLEREKFPRYHIGESLVPGILPLLDQLGLGEQIDRFGFVRKNGITLRWGRQREPWTVHFGEVGPIDHAYQVVRSEFDELLLQNARRLGATVREEAEVRGFLFEDGRCVGVRYEFGGRSHRARARITVDASGQGHLLGRGLGLIEWDEGLRNVATWAYYEGGASFGGPDAGNILVENLPGGWLWTIPLHDGSKSVGFVAPASAVRGRSAASGETLLQAIEASQETDQLLRSARLASGFRTIRDWSYVCRRFHGPGFLLAGDAAGFVDPLFSTGVFLALNGGSRAAEAADRILSGRREEEATGLEYQAAYRSFLDVVFSFVRYFYDASKDKELYWGRARELVDPFGRLTARQDFVYLISGLGGVAVMDLPAVDTAGAGQPELTEQGAAV
jgi:clorobiocin biosynthesis protein Clo-hal